MSPVSVFRASDRSVRVACPGGAIAPGLLRKTVGDICRAGRPGARVGIRQDFIIDFPGEKEAGRFSVATGALRAENIASSLIAFGIEPATPWLSEGHYQNLAEALHPVEGVSVSLADPRQQLAPLFPAEVNFVAAEIAHHWHLLLRGPDGGRSECADFLVPSFVLKNIVQWTRSRSAADRAHPAGMYRALRKEMGHSALDVARRADDFPRSGPDLTAYEGFHAGPDGTYRLGIFRENFLYPALLLDELAALSSQHRTGPVYLSPYHSILVKHIPAASLSEWAAFTRRHGLNLRHDTAILGWRVAESGLLRVRDAIVRILRKTDFALAPGVFAGVDYEHAETGLALVPETRRFFRDRFRLMVREGLPDARGAWVCAGTNLSVQALGALVLDLGTGADRPGSLATLPGRELLRDEGQPPVADGPRPSAAGLFQCADCLSVYDPRHGDHFAKIRRNVEFSELPATYSCPVCGGDRAGFRPVLAGF